ncbi:hypothetical protein N665_0441s0030 [Sinapis alba]|nr:hypothetical protein N665_0441s0030 [Sinapis alba]
MKSDKLWSRSPAVKTGKSEFPVIRFLRGYLEKIKDKTGGPGVGGGLGCGAGLGIGLTGGNVVFGIGMGCGIGLGFGYGFGVGGGINFDDIGDYLTYEKRSGSKSGSGKRFFSINY